MTDADGAELLRAKTTNLSDGGALLVPALNVLPVGREIHINLRVPRETPNTFMYEDFFSDARIVRHDPVRGDQSSAMAVRFAESLNLNLAV